MASVTSRSAKEMASSATKSCSSQRLEIWLAPNRAPSSAPTTAPFTSAFGPSSITPTSPVKRRGAPTSSEHHAESAIVASWATVVRGAGGHRSVEPPDRPRAPRAATARRR